MIERFSSWFLARKKRAYVATFKRQDGTLHPEAAAVISDLARAARWRKGSIVVSPVARTVDPYATAYQAGMRDMVLRILEMLEMSELDLKELKHYERSIDAERAVRAGQPGDE